MNDSHWHDRIRQEPDNETLLLIYADWLEEQGDVRAEKIRTGGICPACVGRGVSIHASAAYRANANNKDECALCSLEKLRSMFNAATSVLPDAVLQWWRSLSNREPYGMPNSESRLDPATGRLTDDTDTT